MFAPCMRRSRSSRRGRRGTMLLPLFGMAFSDVLPEPGLRRPCRSSRAAVPECCPVGDVADARRRADEVLVAEAVEVGARAGFAVVERVVALRRPGVARAADVGLRRREAGRHVGQRLQADVAARQRLESLGVQRFLLTHRLRVDDGSGAADRDRLCEGADAACVTFTVAVKPVPSSMPSRLTVENPASEKVTV